MGARGPSNFQFRAQNASDGPARGARCPPAPNGAAKAEEQKGRRAEKQRAVISATEKETGRREQHANIGLQAGVGA